MPEPIKRCMVAPGYLHGACCYISVLLYGCGRIAVVVENSLAPCLLSSRIRSKMFDLSLNDSALPYPDPLHPIVVHFVIAMVLFAFFCDVIGHFTHSPKMLEVSFWNMVVASVAIFFAIVVGQFEAGLAPTYPAVTAVLTRHQLLGWSLSAIVVMVTAWRFVIRTRSLFKIPPVYLGAASLLVVLVFLQVYLGSQLVWEYGLHVKPVVQAIESGELQ